MKQAVWQKVVALVMAGALWSSCALASVVISSTRVIYKADDREVTVKVNNPGKEPALVQVWADRGNEKSVPNTADAPFLIMPPIFRIDPAKGQTIRLTFTGADLPTDRESVFWLNVLDIPPLPKKSSEQQNFMQVAFRSRIKLFYRPEGLAGNPDDAAGQLVWTLKPQDGGKGYVLHAVNASAFHVSLNRALLAAGARQYETDGGMVPPGGSHDFLVKNLKGKPEGNLSLSYESINDYGAPVSHAAAKLEP
ncbi:fimbrial biogenesis chaperone [Chromobacterium amazonense]|uniref:Fimbria/pilus periplasmic chaperone n=1 Tax=Chromobacterium amazonense TaxID=1382803 RepID=A0ABU8V5A5_9NEIS|nr:fimbria/pilus periplasmic chaperone [Chromobacterium amazonense]KIA80520.1 molecular chaperone EcpD [Chromobacterium piscinae]MBM2883123.1 fimbria/pilus periplasmic chaperone [Chromobacterium amazonense]MDE1712813.1 fimbria/pilus periplasmic chaperone [Chromobacterium amazonense]MDQ4540626.1 fimbria/pilus periplasmic chaperone [Chromobacterium amazonense]